VNAKPGVELRTVCRKCEKPPTKARGKNRKKRNLATQASSVVVTRVDPSEVQSEPKEDQWAISELKAYRRDRDLCKRDQCGCLCTCHNGTACLIEESLARTHTRSHKKQRMTFRGWKWEHDGVTYIKRDDKGLRQEVDIYCHDCHEASPMHWRKPWGE
jgi:hypothetical protein